jgi:hypothetical protein
MKLTIFVKLNRKINGTSKFQAPTSNNSKRGSYVNFEVGGKQAPLIVGSYK